MKNILKLLAIGFFAFGVSACDPMDDIYDDLPNDDSTTIDNLNKVPAVANYTLADVDYEYSSNDSIANNKYFFEEAPAIDYLPEIINEVFLADVGAETRVTYNYLYPLDTVTKEYPHYEVDSSEYGNDYYNFSSHGNLYNLLSSKHPNAKRADLAELTYAWRSSGTTDTVTYTFACLEPDEWTITYKLSSEEYYSMEQSYPNFSNTDDPKRYVPVFIETLSEYQYAQPGDRAYIVYVVYGDEFPHILQLEKEQYQWKVIESAYPKTASLTANGETWSVAPPIDFVTTTQTNDREYTLTSADYEMVGNGQYGNFDNESTVIEKISTILKANFEDIEVGQVFLVHYKFYSGAVEDRSINLEAIAKE
ncbi:MAG: hypothetical protein PF489_04095 [Salinivirgaceae bacterium]|jgi:hypothetical protein|nr:hypothetical protein [Salinivirgaceae bacterium]